MTALTWLKELDPIRAGTGLFGILFLLAAFLLPVRSWVDQFARLERPRARERVYLSVLAFVASVLSLGYVAYYLKGGPRGIDATSYYLEARAISDGQFAWQSPDPSASFRGRFLLFSSPNHLGVIFPPGYPLLLSLGFILGSPLLIGPLLAGALAVVTYLLAREFSCEAGLDEATQAFVARLAGVFSLFSAALRYHTADTMSHGAAALGVALFFLCLLIARRDKNGSFYALSGLAAGYVVATRPVTGMGPILVGAIVTLLFSAETASSANTIGKGGAFRRFVLGALPFCLYLFASQSSVVGHWFSSAQAAYYAASDGPPGCFRLGISSDIGCQLEHGDFLSKYMPDGFTIAAAIGTTLRRLFLHLGDVTNSEGLTFLLLAASLRIAKRAQSIRFAWTLVALQIVLYFPFYFDGNYPAAGGRLLADVLPIEHALGAVGLALLFVNVPLATRAYAALAVSLLSFAGYAFVPHEVFAASLGGRPMYEPNVVHEAGVVHGVIYVDTDHGFNLSHVPETDPKYGLLSLRLRGDDRDRLAYELFGHPTSRKYVFDTTGKEPPRVEFFIPPSPRGAWRFEIENEWPPFLQEQTFAKVASHAPASGGKWLVVDLAKNASSGRVDFDFPVVPSRHGSAKPHVGLLGKNGKATLTVTEEGAPEPLATWSWVDDGPEGGLRTLDAQVVKTRGSRARASLVVEGGPVALDAFFVDEEH